MAGIAKKLRDLIGEQSVKSWAEEHDLSGQTVHEWIKHDRRPGFSSMKALVAATGYSKEWWLSGEETPPEVEANRLISEPIKDPYATPTPAKIPNPPSNINVDALVQAICVTFNTAKPGESLERSARRAVAFYQYCWDQGLINEHGEGEGNLKRAA
jgi:hypothetical protein